jgi:hypothetical protein
MIIVVCTCNNNIIINQRRIQITIEYNSRRVRFARRTRKNQRIFAYFSKEYTNYLITKNTIRYVTKQTQTTLLLLYTIKQTNSNINCELCFVSADLYRLRLIATRSHNRQTHVAENARHAYSKQKQNKDI